MQMADALISPLVGGTMLAVSTGFVGYSARTLSRNPDDAKVPLMGVMGAFVFSAQMINFTIPGTGSSGHIGGGMLLAALLGPVGGFLTMAAVLLIQALFFGDGGLLAYGCNLFNLGVFTCFFAYPLVWRRVMGKGIGKARIAWGSVLSVVIALQLGSFAVVLETFASGRTDLPFGAFLLLMQPIHLAIGVVEGLITAAILTFVHQARPELLAAGDGKLPKALPLRGVLVGIGIAALLLGGVFSLFASQRPDGLEWSITGIAGSPELEAGGTVHRFFAGLQAKTAFLPDYNIAGAEGATEKAGTSVSGVVGGALTLLLAVLAGIAVKRFRKQARNA